MPGLAAEESRKLILGLDFGGTKLAAGLVKLDSGRLKESGMIPSRPAEGASGAVKDMIALASRLAGIEQIEGIGVCFGGHVHGGVIQRSLHISGWQGFPLEDQLTGTFGAQEVRIANDANANALGEWRFGAGRGVRSMIYITVSTGIGGGIILGERLYTGQTGMAGEIGHTKVMPDGPLCSCGRHGCLEAVAAGPAIVSQARNLIDEHRGELSKLAEGSKLTTKEIARLAREGDKLARQLMLQAGHYLGIGIANVVNLLDIELVVVGGGVSLAGGAWWQAVKDTVQAEIMPQRGPVQLRRAELTPYGGVWGAAALFV